MLVDWIEALRAKIDRLSGPQKMSLSQLTTMSMPRIGPIQIWWAIYQNKSLLGAYSNQYGRLETIRNPATEREIFDIRIEEWKAIESVVELETAKYLIARHELEIRELRFRMFRAKMDVPWDIRAANEDVFRYLDDGLTDEELDRGV